MLRTANYASKCLFVFNFLVLSFSLSFYEASALDLSESGFNEEQWATGIVNATAMVFGPDGNLYALREGGDIRVITADGTLQSTPFMSLSVNSSGERGLLGMAFDPNYLTNRYFYVYHTAANTVHNTLSRFQRDSSNALLGDPSTEVILLDASFSNRGYHNGGAIHFGNDGMLYVAVGDDHNDDRDGSTANAQNLNKLEGSLLRLNVANYPASIVPNDNPFVGQANVRQEIWAYGLRNPFTFSVDPVSGTIHINDVGQGTWEEINVGASGANYGWNSCEGSCSNSSFVNPIYAYNHSGGATAITGGTFYRGNQFPSSYNGVYFFQDYNAGWVRVLHPDNSVTTWGTNGGRAVDLKVGPDGALYRLERGGRVMRYSYVGSGNRNPIAAISANPQAGEAPLQVSFNGAGSSDPDNDPITYNWDFGDGSATASAVSVNHTYNSPGVYTARLTVTDTQSATDNASINISVGTAPIASIANPSNGALYNAGNTISYSGSATDAEDGILPISALSWLIVFHHDTHTHPFLGPITGVTGGTFDIPTVGETAPNVWYRIHLTATDSTGLQHTATRDIFPRKVNLSIVTNPPGLEIRLDGLAHTSPYTVQSVIGIERILSVTTAQTSNGINYVFDSWSDGGSDAHSINTPATDTTYTATFRELAPPTTPQNLRIVP